MQVLPEVRHAWLVQEATEDAVAHACAAGVAQLCPRADTVSRPCVQHALQAGLSVRCWGVKDVSVCPVLPRLHECACVSLHVLV
jgi:hypothetical protein